MDSCCVAEGAGADTGTIRMFARAVKAAKLACDSSNGGKAAAPVSSPSGGEVLTVQLEEGQRVGWEPGAAACSQADKPTGCVVKALDASSPKVAPGARLVAINTLPCEGMVNLTPHITQY